MMRTLCHAPPPTQVRYPDGFHNLLAEPKLKDNVMKDIASWIRKVAK